MKNLISLLIFLLFAWLAMWWYYSCDWCAKDITNSTTVVNEKENLEAEALAKKALEDSIAAAKKMMSGLFVKDLEDQDIFRYPDNLKINNENGDVFIPASLQDFGTKIADYLGQHQDQELIIYGYENTSERDQNLEYGATRANFIKNLLVEVGINPDRIVTKELQKNYEYDTDGNYNGGIDLKFNTLNKERLAEVEKSITDKVLYSEFGQKTFQPDATLSNYTLELKSYLDKHPDEVITVTGHTDNVGTEEANLWYGQQRANNVKQHFISQGIPKEKIKALSEGELSPIVPNDSDENKAKNRRIEISVN
ncbi:OmpA family protein [Aquimarina sp. 2201CG1-2-11]|uniref:OmpA family protein n=1 Tax=Aquimarina discodermiae TaxID=3231043 RepID=UPI0034621D1B